MIILYSITGVVATLFIGVILIGVSERMCMSRWWLIRL